MRTGGKRVGRGRGRQAIMRVTVARSLRTTVGLLSRDGESPPEILTSPPFGESHHAVGRQSESLRRLRKGRHDLNEAGGPARLRINRFQKIGGGRSMEVDAMVYRGFRGGLEVSEEVRGAQHREVEAVRLEDDLAIPHAVAVGAVVAEDVEGPQPSQKNVLVLHTEFAGDFALVFRGHEIQETDEAAHRHELRSRPNRHLASVLLGEVEDELLLAELSLALLLVVILCAIPRNDSSQQSAGALLEPSARAPQCPDEQAGHACPAHTRF